jgi:hypothetical protein
MKILFFNFVDLASLQGEAGDELDKGNGDDKTISHEDSFLDH